MAEGQQRKLSKAERAKLLLTKDAFPKNAFFIFSKAAEFVSGTGVNGVDLLDQMLHSILFLGNIHATMYSPDIIFADLKVYDDTKKTFEGPFNRYREDVPLRTPFSYFLELIVRRVGENNEERVKAILVEILRGCKKSDIQYPLISSVICICRASNRRYYGGSLTCPGDIEREIMTAVSCLHVWHPYVSSAVLSVFPEDTTEPRFPHGIIKLPASVECRAFDIENLRVKPPCLRCHELYSLPNNTRNNRNNPGNCAETEAISILLTNERMLRSVTTMNGDVLERRDIEQRMRSHFDRKMNERMAGRARINRSSYNINRIYTYNP